MRVDELMLDELLSRADKDGPTYLARSTVRELVADLRDARKAAAEARRAAFEEACMVVQREADGLEVAYRTCRFIRAMIGDTKCAT